MQTYQIVHNTLLDLENRYFRLARTHFPAPDNCATGGIQFAAVDTKHKLNPEPMPVICAVGINYTQKPWRGKHAFFSYLSRGSAPKVEKTTTGSRNAVARLLAAYNRNSADWTARSAKGVIYPNEPGPFGSPSATPKRLVSHNFTDLKDDFILVMTNRCPFITALKWEDQIRTNAPLCDALLQAWPNNSYMNDLFLGLGKAVDLWIGHSAIWTHGSLYGTAYVWPYFRCFIGRHRIQKWLLSPNINPRAHLSFNGCFRAPGNRRCVLFK